MTDYFFGEIPGNPVGTKYVNRMTVTRAGVHRVTQQGISGNESVGCASIVLSGGYDTDEDYGHEIFYTGRGGQDPQNKKQHIAHQTLELSDNAALVKSEETGLPIRIVRGSKGEREQSPAQGYRYDGLYKVVAHYLKVPEDGFRRWMFHLVQLTRDEAAAYTPSENIEADAVAYTEHNLGSEPIEGGAPSQAARTLDPFFDPPFEIVIPAGKTDPGTKTVISQRIIRDTKITAAIKLMYKNSCQICGTQLSTKTGYYSEGAHIRPLGQPHHGPDTMANVLCLCPNHHAAFDMGGIYLGDDLNARDAGGRVVAALSVHSAHEIDLNNVRYHRGHHGHAIAGKDGLSP